MAMEGSRVFGFTRWPGMGYVRILGAYYQVLSLARGGVHGVSWDWTSIQ